MIVDFPLLGKVEMTPEAQCRYVASMRDYYDSLPVTDQSATYLDLREEWCEREAIQAEAAASIKERRIFKRRETA